MRESANSFDHGSSETGRYHNPRHGKRRQWFDDESYFAKRQTNRPRLAAEDANDATDGLPEGDLWSTWDLGTDRNVDFQRLIRMVISVDSANWVRSAIFRPQGVRAA